METTDWINTVQEGDCLALLPLLPDKSIDMVLCDLPYGITENPWDTMIPLDLLWTQYRRLIKDGGVIALTGLGSFTARLILSNERWFKYKIIWIKSDPTNFLNAKKQPLRRHEDICIFYNRQPVYYPQMTKGKPYDKGSDSGRQTGSYGKFEAKRHKNFTGLRYPNDVLFIEERDPPDWVYCRTAKSEGPVLHPTQKPVALGRYLIRTYTNPNDIILDHACGSGSFLVAAILEGRRCIGIELNEHAYRFKVQQINWIDVCKSRIKDALKQREEDKGKLSLFEDE